MALAAGCGGGGDTAALSGTAGAGSGVATVAGVVAGASAGSGGQGGPPGATGTVGATGAPGPVGATGVVAGGAAAVTVVAGAAGAAVTGGSRPDADAAGTVWLCRPGQVDNPCEAPRTATVVPPDGPPATQPAVRPAGGGDASAFDCFYVYPTVSPQPSDNATLQVQGSQTGMAISQASRFSQVCRVWAPMYRQRTAASLRKGLGADPRADAVAYDSVLAAWRDYLANDNQGRPVVFIGHSQGAAMLIRLLAGQVDDDPVLRARTVLAILVGGNVTVPLGRTVGATFSHLPLCTASGQTGCVIAYSTFGAQPPRDAAFGRPGQGISLMSGQHATAGVQVACVNPAALGGGAAELQPYFRAARSTGPSGSVVTGWVTYPSLYSARCVSGGDGAGWLQIDAANPAGRPVLPAVAPGSGWGYHAYDVNLALGDLVADVAAAESGYQGRRP